MAFALCDIHELSHDSCNPAHFTPAVPIRHVLPSFFEFESTGRARVARPLQPDNRVVCMTIDSPVASTAGSSATTFVPTGTATDHVGSADGAAAAEEVASVRSMQVTLNDSVVDAEKSGVKDASDIIWVDWDGAE